MVVMIEFGPDIISENTYAAVGRAISSWEIFELQMAELYSIFVGRHNDLEVITNYGADPFYATFEKRMTFVGNAAEKYFLKYPSQEIEGTFCSLVGRARELSHKRHQIAHGIVMSCGLPSEKAHKAGLIEYAVRPPWYAIISLTKHSGRDKDVGIWGGGYDYKVADLTTINSEFEALQKIAKNLVSTLLSR